jgi:hypothetical protein
LVKSFSHLCRPSISRPAAPTPLANKKNPDEQYNHHNDDHQRPESYGVASGFLERRPEMEPTETVLSFFFVL